MMFSSDKRSFRSTEFHCREDVRCLSSVSIRVLEYFFHVFNSVFILVYIFIAVQKGMLEYFLNIFYSKETNWVG